MSTKTVFQSGLMSVGTLGNALLGLIFYIFMARALSVGDFGHFSYLLAIGLMVSEVADFGLSSALIKFGSGENFPATFTVVAAIRTIMSAVVTLVFITLAVLVDPLFSYAAFITISTMLFQGLVAQSLLARQFYGWYVGTFIAGNTFRLGALYALSFLGELTVGSGLALFAVSNGVSALIGIIPIVFKFNTQLVSLGRAKRELRQIYNYARWLGLSYGLASFGAKIDSPLVYFLGGPVSAGVYASAQRLASIFPQMSAAVEGVFAPKLSVNNQEPSFKHYLLVASLLAFGALTLIILGPVVIPVVLGAKYAGATPVFQLLMVGMALFFLSGPFSASVIYLRSKTSYHFFGSAVQLIATIVFYFLLIPGFGPLGAALAFVGSQMVNLGYYILVWRKIS